MHSARVLALALLLLAPVAAAEGPVEGEVRFVTDALLRGDVALAAEDGGLDLAEAARRGEPLALSWGNASGELVTRGWHFFTDAAGRSYTVSRPPGKETLPLGPGTLRRVTCAGPCEVLALGPVGLRGAAAGPLGWLDAPSVHWGSGSANEGLLYKDGHAFARTFPAGTFAASGRADESATRLRDATPSAQGDLLLFLKNASLEFIAADGRLVTVDARERAATTADAPGLARAEEVEERFALLRLQDASLAAPPGGSARFLAERPTVTLDGRLSGLATGRLEHGGAAREFDGEALDVEGRLVLAPEVAPRPGEAVASLLQPPALHARVSGEAERVRVGGAPVGGDPAAPLGAAATDATGLAALLAALWAFLYSRIGRGRALQNANRARLYALVCAEPGVTAAELRRRVGLARMVVRHHLQLLEAHGLVTRRADGRRQRYFSTDAPAGDVQAAPRFLLEGDARRRVFDALAGSAAPLTQRELVDRTGLSQRLVSYHLARLEAAGGVVAAGALPRRYAVRPGWVDRGGAA